MGHFSAHQSDFPVETGPPVRICKGLNVSHSGYYYWLAQRSTNRANKNETILGLLSWSLAASKDPYGSPKITQDLRAQGVNVSRPRVAGLMKLTNLKRIIEKTYMLTTTASKRTYSVTENHLNRQFKPAKPGQAWVLDLAARTAPLHCHR